jgi:hypothetical protein
MKVRVIKRPEFEHLHHLQIKKWWHLTWVNVFHGSEEACMQGAENLLSKGVIEKVIFQGETKS